MSSLFLAPKQVRRKNLNARAFIGIFVSAINATRCIYLRSIQRMCRVKFIFIRIIVTIRLGANILLEPASELISEDNVENCLILVLENHLGPDKGLQSKVI